ncbi:MAG: phosphatidylinositol alpha-mannosyltransferase [Actinomycetota bacterium]
MVGPDSDRREVSARGLLRIGLLCPYSLTTPGGVQGQVMGLARALRRFGHEVRVLGPCDGAPPDTFVTPIGESLPTVANGSIAPLAPDPSAALRTIRVLRDEGFDVLHLHEPLTPGPNLTALVMRTAPIVGTFHAAGDSLSYKYLNGPLKGFASAIDARIAVSKDAVALAQRYLGGDYAILPNAVDIDQYRPTPGATVKVGSSLRKSIFFCGRHEPRKGLEILLRAHAQLADDVELVIASDGPETERLKSEFPEQDRVRWLGRITEMDKAEHLRQASVFCAPSLGGESFGVVLIEAMAAHTPVVASALDGYMNVATDDLDAVLVEPGDVEALRDALSRILSDSSLVQRLTEAASQRANDFSMTALARAYVDVYHEVIEDRLREVPRWNAGSTLQRSLSGTFPAEIGDISEFIRRFRATLRSVTAATWGRDVPRPTWVSRFAALLADRVRRMLRR